MKNFIGLLLVFALITFTASTSYGHSGRTDSKGGHHTSKCDHAKSICYYHYH